MRRSPGYVREASWIHARPVGATIIRDEGWGRSSGDTTTYLIASIITSISIINPTTEGLVVVTTTTRDHDTKAQQHSAATGVVPSRVVVQCEWATSSGIVGLQTPKAASSHTAGGTRIHCAR